MNPIPPRCLGDHCFEGNPCQVCGNNTDCTSCDNTPDPSFPPLCDETGKPGRCSGNQPGPDGPVSVLDELQVPFVEPGKYVLQWRWDCEATAQVWTNCADITISKWDGPILRDAWRIFAQN